ncbi:hypothetical protein ACTA71_007974 [Dictyostelium dimigraforme]
MHNNNNNFGGGGYNQGGGYNSSGYNNNNGFNNGNGYNNGGYNGGGYNNGNGYGNNNGGFNNNNRPQQQQQQYVNNNNNNNNSFDNNSYGGDDEVTNNADYQSTTRNIQQIQNAVQTLTKLVNLLGTPKDSMDTREKIRNCVDSTTHLISSESSKVKNLTSLANRSRESKNKLLYQKLVKEFNNCLQQFKDIAQVATKKEKATPLPVAPDHQPTQFGRNNNNNNNNQNNHFLNNQQPYYDNDNGEDEHQSLMESSRRQQLAQIEAEREYQNSIIQERDEGIRKIEQSIVEINEIFVDLSGLVAEQGVMINTIEASLESTAINTKEGVNHLREASKNQKSSRNKMCWIVLILLIVCAVLGVILFFTLRK